MANKDTVVTVISDIHAGSAVSLCPLSWNLYDGGTYQSSPGQKIIYRQWIKSANVIKDLRQEGRGRKQLVLILNGDSIDGVHHDANQLVTSHKTEQIAMAIDLIDEWLQIAEYNPKSGDRIYIIRGTTAHERGEYNNQIGRELDGVVPYSPDSSKSERDGRYYFDKLRRVINNNLFDVAHEGFGVGSRKWYESNLIRYSLASMYYECLEEGLPIPNYVIRAHKHRYVYDTYKLMWGCVTPCWTMKTNFVYKIAANQLINTIGLVYVDVLKSGHSKPYAEYIKVQDTQVKEL